MALSVLASSLLLSVAPQSQAPLPTPPPPHHLVQIFVRDAHTMDRITALDLDLAACTAIRPPVRMVDVIATDADIARIRAAGLAFEVAIRNLEEHHRRELAADAGILPNTLTPVLGQGAMGGHYTLTQIGAILDQFAASYPGLCATKVSIGNSTEGRPLWMVKISDNVAVDEPQETEILFDALHHAREPLSMETQLYFMDWLLSGYGKNPEATYLVDNRQFYFVPCVNPDGYEYNRSTNPGGGGMWRKNRRNNGGSFGVDLNRNWTTGWTAPNGGNSTTPSSDTYRGPSPLSEPEVSVLNNFILSRGGRIKLGFSTHTYTDIMLSPWGYQNGLPANGADYNRISAEAVQYGGITYGPASTSLYIAAGTALDHYHAAHGMYAWSPELGRSNEGGFWPTASTIPVIANRHLNMFKVVAMRGGADVVVRSVVASERTGNGNSRIDPGETANVVVSIENLGTQPPTADVTATLRAVSAGVTVTVGTANLGRPGKFVLANNGGAPLQFAVTSPFPGRVATLAVDIVIEGRTSTFPIEALFGSAFVTVVDDDIEVDRGFARATSGDSATAGLWARGAPAQVLNGSATAQPGSDHSASGTLCWVTDPAGGSATAADLDGGKTTLVSPIFDLAHAEAARLRFWRWWYDALQPADWMQVELSNDGGGSWMRLAESNAVTTAWTEVVWSLHGVLPFTDRMRVRIIARDEMESVVEGAIDDLVIDAVISGSAVTMWSSGVRGTTARLGRNGGTGEFAITFMSPNTASFIVPGIGGTLLIDPLSMFSIDVTGFGPTGYAALDLPIPSDPSLSGAALYFQDLGGLDLATLQFSNRTVLRIQ